MKAKIESMTGLEVVEVNVIVQGIHMDAKQPEEE